MELSFFDLTHICCSHDNNYWLWAGGVDSFAIFSVFIFYNFANSWVLFGVFQSACLSVCQYLTASKDNIFEEDIEDSDSDSESMPYQPTYVPPTAAAPTVLGKPKARKPRPTSSPPLPEVTRIMEMGFRRKQVEYAIKALGK